MAMGERDLSRKYKKITRKCVHKQNFKTKNCMTKQKILNLKKKLTMQTEIGIMISLLKLSRYQQTDDSICDKL